MKGMSMLPKQGADEINPSRKVHIHVLGWWLSLWAPQGYGGACMLLPVHGSVGTKMFWVRVKRRQILTWERQLKGTDVRVRGTDVRAKGSASPLLVWCVIVKYHRAEATKPPHWERNLFASLPPPKHQTCPSLCWCLQWSIAHEAVGDPQTS